MRPPIGISIILGAILTALGCSDTPLPSNRPVVNADPATSLNDPSVRTPPVPGELSTKQATDASPAKQEDAPTQAERIELGRAEFNVAAINIVQLGRLQPGEPATFHLVVDGDLDPFDEIEGWFGTNIPASGEATLAQRIDRGCWELTLAAPNPLPMPTMLHVRPSRAGDQWLYGVGCKHSPTTPN